MFLRFVLIFVVSIAAVPDAGDDSEQKKPVDTSSRISAPIDYGEIALVVTHESGVAVVDFTDSFADGVNYRYRYLPADGSGEMDGQGKVFEKYKRIPTDEPGHYEVVDDGGQLHVKVGGIELEWSLGSDDSGWIYYCPETVTVQIVEDDDFDEIQLRRFR